MRSDHALAEDIYMEVYELSAEKAEYLQPDNSALLLPESLVAAFAGTVISAVVTSVLGEFGKDVYGKFKELLPKKSRPKDESEVMSSDDVVALLAEVIPELRKRRAELNGAYRETTEELVKLNVSEEGSRLIASRTIEIFVESLKTDEQG
jgi:hypothetical protein